MRYLTPALAAALALAAPAAHAFTFDNQSAAGNYSTTPNNFGATLNNYGSTLSTPGQTRSNFGDALSSTPSTNNAGTGSQMGGFSFHVGPQSNGSTNLRPPAWSNNPLYFERGPSQ
jgi:hypothetical protein